MRSQEPADRRVFTQADEERRNMLLSLIKQKALAYEDGPYADYNALWNREGLKERYFSSGFFLSEEACEQMGLEKDHLPEISLARWTASVHVARKIEEKGISQRECGRRAGINVATIARVTTLSRALALEPEQAVALSHGVFNESVNKLYLGFDGRVVLPRVYSEIMRMFCALPEPKRRELADAAVQLSDSWKEKNPGTYGLGAHKDVRLMVCERMQELARSSGRNAMEFIRGERIPQFMKILVRWYFEEELREKEPFPKLAVLMFLSLELKMSLDYFLTVDYPSFVPCFYTVGTEEVEIRDRSAVRFLTALTSVDEETSNKITAPLFWEVFKSRQRYL